MDHFTCYAEVYVTLSQMALTTTKTLLDNFIIHYGLPEKILPDQGRNFESKLIADTCRLMGTKKLRTSPYHPQMNGQCERFNSTLSSILGTLPPKCKSDWRRSIGELVHAYNCTQNSATGFSPYFLMYGKTTQLSIDVTLRLTPNSVATPTSTWYIQKLREHIRWAHSQADLFQQKEAWHHKQNYDKCSKAVALRMGDTVLIHVTTFKGRHKIQNRWENRADLEERWPYPNLPVYVVCPIDEERHSQALHWNYVLPISNNLEQVECENPVEEVKPSDEPTPVPQAYNMLPANWPTASWPESISNSAPDEHELANPELTGLTSPDPTNDWLKSEDTMSVLLWWSSRKTRNQLPLRYWNFVVLQMTPLLVP